MSTAKHDQSDRPSGRELDSGIGQPKGAFLTGKPPQSLEDESTEGDGGNDAAAVGGASDRRLGRTNA